MTVRFPARLKLLAVLVAVIAAMLGVTLVKTPPASADREAYRPRPEAAPDRRQPQPAPEPRAFVKDWTMADLDGLLGAGLEGNRDFENGRRLFGATRCSACHRFQDEGAATGPDLSRVGAKHGPQDLLRRILEPDREISEAYAQTEVALRDGGKVRGRLVGREGDPLILETDLADPKARATIARKDIKSMGPSQLSLMPRGLLNSLGESDILDLLAFLLSQGNRNDPMFQ